MAPARSPRAGATLARAFDARAFLDSSGIAKRIAKYARGESIFTKGDACDHVLYIQSGGVKLSVTSKTGREAVVAALGPGDFFGEGCLTGQPVRIGRATAITPSVILHIGRTMMARVLRQHHAMSDRFISHMLSRNIRIEEDLIEQIFNSTEKRVARTLLLLARYGTQENPIRRIPHITHGALAEMVGTTSVRAGFFLNKFKRLGFIEYSGELPITINRSLLNVVLHD